MIRHIVLGIVYCILVNHSSFLYNNICLDTSGQFSASPASRCTTASRCRRTDTRLWFPLRLERTLRSTLSSRRTTGPAASSRLSSTWRSSRRCGQSIWSRIGWSRGWRASLGRKRPFWTAAMQFNLTWSPLGTPADMDTSSGIQYSVCLPRHARPTRLTLVTSAHDFKKFGLNWTFCSRILKYPNPKPTIRTWNRLNEWINSARTEWSGFEISMPAVNTPD